MTRRIEIGKECIVIHLTGVTSIAALKRTLEIPYASIVQVAREVPNRASLIRLGGTSVGDIQEGHFWHGEHWYFLSYEHPEQVVCLTLNDFTIGHRVYKVVAFGAEHPAEVCEAIRSRIAGRERR